MNANVCNIMQALTKDFKIMQIMQNIQWYTNVCVLGCIKQTTLFNAAYKGKLSFAEVGWGEERQDHVKCNLCYCEMQYIQDMHSP